MAGPAVACHVQINFIPTQGNANLNGRRIIILPKAGNFTTAEFWP